MSLPRRETALERYVKLRTRPGETHTVQAALGRGGLRPHR